MSLDSCDCVFHGIGYNLTITVTHGSTNSSSSSSSSSSTTQFQDSNNGSSSSSSSSLSSEPTLFVDLEELSTSSSWHGEFSSSYVENITRKTGSFKRFDVLVKMLVGALQARTETVFLDLLTYADLEALRVRKAGGPSSAVPNASTPARTVTVATNTKRYLILTYVAEFDRIHYPLPLLFEEVPTVSSLSRLVRRLRSEVLSFRSLAGLAAQAPALIAGGLPASNIESLSSSVQGLQRENSLLRQMLTEQQGKVNEEKDSVNTLKAQITSLHEVNKVGEAAIERLRNASKTEVKKLRSEIAELQSRLGNGNGPLSSSSSSSSGNVLVESGDDSNTRGSSSSTSAIISSASNDMLVQLKESNDALSKRVQELTKQLALTKGSSATSGLGTAVQRGRTLQTRTGVSNGGGASSRSPAVASRSPAMSSSTRLSTSTSKQQVSSTLSTSQQQRGRSSSVGSAGSVKRSNSNASATSKGVSSQNRRTPTPVRNTTTSTLSQGQGGVGRSSSNTTPTSIGSGTSAGPRPGSRAYYNAKVAAARASPSGSSRLAGGTNTPPPPPPISAGVSLELTNPTAGKSNGATQSTSSASPIGTRSNVLSSKLSAQIGGGTGGGRSTSRGSAGKAAASLSQSPYLTSIGPMLQTLERGPAGRKSATPTREITGIGRGISTAPSGSRSNSTGKGRGGESQNEPPITHSSSLSSSSNLETQKPVVTQPVTAILEPPAVPRTAWVASVADNSSSTTSTSVPAFVVHSPSSSKYEASSEIQDIDARLAQLQDFLRAAKNGDPLPSL
jgi:coiled-coil domain-containing protein 61